MTKEQSPSNNTKRMLSKWTTKDEENLNAIAEASVASLNESARQQHSD